MSTEVAFQFPSTGVSIVADSGSGRTYVALLDDPSYLSLATAAAERLAVRARSVVVACAPVSATSWESLSVAVAERLQGLGVRQASLIGFGAGATIAQNLALNDAKFVRSLVVVDATARPHPTRWERFVDAIEERLPFGLPLRLGSSGFNVKAYLHRFRCPLLVVATRRASAFMRDELKSLSRLAPTAWLVELSTLAGDQEVTALSDTVESFQDTPVKCPQKNLKGAA